MMQRAGRYHALRGLILFVLLAVAATTGLAIRDRLIERDKANHATGLVGRVFDADITQVPGIIKEMEAYRAWTNPLLKDAKVKSAADPRQQLHASLALLPVDPSQLRYLYGRLLQAEPQELLVIRVALSDHGDALSGPLWTLLEKPTHDPAQRLRAACALAHYDAVNPRWDKAAPDVAAILVRHDPFAIAKWTDALQPAASFLLPSLAAFLEDEKRSLPERGLIAKVFGNYAATQPDAVPRLEARLAEEPPPNASAEARLAHIKRQASCAAALLVMGHGEKAWPLLKHQPDPTRRSFLMERIIGMGVDPKVLIAKQRHTHPSIQRALLLCLGDYGVGPLPQSERQNLLEEFDRLYLTLGDPGIHGAFDRLLRQWQGDDALKALDKRWTPGDGPGDRRWYICKAGLTMVRIDKPGDVWVGDGKSKHQRRVARNFAMASKEVTVEQFRQFRKDHVYGDKVAPTPNCPVNNVSWYEAAEYCNYLSARDEIPKDQWCYLPNAQGKFADGMTLAPNYWQRTGYRLPTEAEWIHACRAGAETDFFFGHSVELLNSYVWNAGNALGLSHPVGTRKPNDFGLFDMHGNAWEWTQDVYHEQTPLPGSKLREDIQEDLEVKAKVDRVVIGGSWGNQSVMLRSAYPIWYVPGYRSPGIGFRPARTLPVD